MITPAMNDRLTRVGPGTPCGELMRRYWIPFGPAAQLRQNPVRKMRLLGEDLVSYRDKSGTYGLIGDRCLHRRVDLQFGIPDQCGLRCPYHGWLYDESGTCIERPLEAKPNAEVQRKLTGYPVKELGGMLFAYMGPLPAPALPRWDLFVLENAVKQIAINVLDCNWLQCQENTGDPLHSVWTHGKLFEFELEKRGDVERLQAIDHTVHSRLKMGVGIKEVYAEATPYGFRKGVVYSKELGAEHDSRDEHSTVMFPFYTQTGRCGAARSEYQIRVPIDDTHTLHLCYQTYAAPPEIPVPKQEFVPYYEPPTIDEQGRPILDYVLAQDAIVWTAQGDIVDRSQEMLGRTDVPIVLLRRQLDEQITLVEEGKTPMNWFTESPDVIHGAAPNKPNPDILLAGNFRKLYHKGYGTDDVDRYGPAFDLAKEVHRSLEAADIAALDKARERAAGAPAS
jgi:5,5'-dehydrodivanillate O-demethylase